MNVNRFSGVEKLNLIISDKDYVPMSQQVKNLADDLIGLSEILKDWEANGFDDEKSAEAVVILKAKSNRIHWLKDKLFKYHNIKHGIVNENK